MVDRNGWTEVKRIEGRDPTRAVVIAQGPGNLFRYEVLKWQRYYEPSLADQGPVEGGFWDGTSSGLYATAHEAEQDARTANPWLLA